jgi:hypothetical protein
MKKILIAAAAMVLSVNALAMSLAEASAKITDIIKDPSMMSSVAKELSADDQIIFLKRINSAIEGTKRSVDSKTSLFCEVNRAALVARKDGNLKSLVAEMFATVPPASLTVINELFAKQLFNRKANPAKPVSDEMFKKHAVSTMEVVQARTTGTDKDVRDAFAILMFLRASEGTPADLKDVLISKLSDEESRQLAKESWIPSAMAEGKAKSYDPMLAVADVSIADTPSPAANFVNLQGPAVLMVSLMSDVSPMVDKNGNAKVVYSEMFLDPNKYALPSEGIGGLNRVPRSLDPNDPWYPGHGRNDDVSSEAGGYRMQTTF